MKIFTAVISAAIFFSCGGSEVKTIILAYSGSVRINNAGIPRTGPMLLKQGDVFETGGSSFCDLKIDDKNIIRIKENSRITFFVKSGESLLQLDSGWLTVITRKEFVSKERYRVKTPSVSADIKGRSFCVKVENGKSSYLCICDGAAEIAGFGSISGDVTGLPVHNAARFILAEDGSLKAETNPGMLYHNDFGNEQMARIIKD